MTGHHAGQVNRAPCSTEVGTRGRAPGSLRLHLDWQVIQTAGNMRSIEIFLNFPIMDMNRNALWHNSDQPSPNARPG